jgi:hypothetical protein
MLEKLSKKTTKRSCHGGGVTMPPEEPRASSVDFSDGYLVVGLIDGREIRVPLEWFPRLRDASSKQLQHFDISPSGRLIHWPKLDEDLTVSGLLGRSCTTCAWRRAYGLDGHG